MRTTAFFVYMRQIDENMRQIDKNAPFCKVEFAYVK